MTKNKRYSIQYGDIIELIAPTNDIIHKKPFFVDYIDARQLQLVNLQTKYILHLNEDAIALDSNILDIHLLSTSNKTGYVLQNELLPTSWIDIVFDFSFILTGIIISTHNDMIEVSLWNSESKLMNERIYIDFEYKGLLHYLHIKEILRRDPPDDFLESLPSTHINEDKNIDENTQLPDQIDIDDELQRLCISSNEFIFQNNRTSNYKDNTSTWQVQVDDMLDNFISQSVPGIHEINIHQYIERLSQLRDLFSIFDENGIISSPFLFGNNYKPLVTDIHFPKWILPVVSSRRKVYTLDTSEEVPYDNNVEIINIQTDIQQYYRCQQEYYATQLDTSITCSPPGTLAKYYQKSSHNQQLLHSMPFGDSNDSNFIKQKILSSDQEALISAYSTSWKQGKWLPTKNILLKYYTNDTIDIHSIIFLPKKVAQFSKINLPSINIMTRSSWNINYLMIFQILSKYNSKHTHFPKHIVDKFENSDSDKNHEIHPNTVDLSIQFFKKTPIEFFLQKDNSIQEDPNKYEKFLKSIIPNTYHLLHMCKSDLLIQSYSFVEIVTNILEPFLIYTKHIHFHQQYEHVVVLLHAIIDKYINKIILKDKKIVIKLRELTKKKPSHINPNQIDQIFIGSHHLDDIYKTQYLSTANLTSSEKLSSIIQHDDSNNLTNFIFSKNIHLTVNPSYVDNVIYDPTQKSDKILSKKYTSLQDLERDNKIDLLYYDIQYDDSPYHILKEYDQEEIKKDDFQEKLQLRLTQEHFSSKSLAHDLANTILLGKKLIRNGEYAILTTKDDNPTFYERNQNNRWVFDKDVTHDTFLSDYDLFGNIIKAKHNSKTKLKLNKFTQHQNIYVAEFKTRLDEIDKKLKLDIASNIEKQFILSDRLKLIKLVQFYKQNNFSFQLGKQIHTEFLPHSPLTVLRDHILSLSDFHLRQTHILNFIHKYTRLALPEENKFWFYCQETNAQLIPVFLFDLAYAYTQGNYSLKFCLF